MLLYKASSALHSHSIEMPHHDLSAAVLLTCGCHLRMGVVCCVVGKQVLAGEEVLCPLHRIPHQYSLQSEFLKFCVGYVAVVENLPVQHVLINGEPVTVEVLKL